MKRPLRPRAIFAAALAAVLSCAACAAGTGAGSADAGPPRSGGTLTFAVTSDAGCVDPQQVGSGDSLYSLRETVDSLTEQDPVSGASLPWLAQSWTVSPDATSFTFRLRPGVTFSDGLPLNAQTVKDNFDAIPHLGTLAVLAEGYLAGYTGTTVVDDLTATVHFDRPNAQFLQATSTASLGLISSADARKTPQQRCAGQVSGTGPFVLSEYVPNQQLSLTRRAGYNWGSPLWAKPGEAYLDKLVFSVIPQAGVRTGSLESEQLDIATGISRADETALRGFGLQVLARPHPGVVFNLGFNLSRPITGDPAVRQALQVAIDRRQLVGAVFPGGTQPAASVLARATPGFTDLSAQLAFDPAKAKAVLDGAGWTTGADGIRVKNGARLSLGITWFANDESYQAALELIQQQLKAVGVEVRLNLLQVAQFPALLQSGDFDVLAGGDLSRADPDGLRTLYSTALGNAYRLPKSPLDELLTAQSASGDPAQRSGFVGQIQQQVVGNAYVLPLAELQTLVAASNFVHGLTFDASSRARLHDTWKS